jgi:DNA-directed RNA polymerase specialized sigma24 family protein
MMAQPCSPDCLSAGERWAGLVARIRARDAGAEEELYHVFSRGIRFQLCRRLGPQDLDDRLHDIFLIITESLRNGELRDPRRLMGYVHTVVRRQMAEHIEGIVQSRRRRRSLELGPPLRDHRPSPERRLIENQTVTVALGLLNRLDRRDREVLVRFYLREQKSSQICREMSLTATQFRLLKSRAKARFGKLGQLRFARPANA